MARWLGKGSAKMGGKNFFLSPVAAKPLPKFWKNYDFAAGIFPFC